MEPMPVWFPYYVVLCIGILAGFFAAIAWDMWKHRK